MASQRTPYDAASQLLSRTLERFDPTAFDIPNGRARLRLVVTGAGAPNLSWDVLLSENAAQLVPATSRARPQALLAADLATWQAIADDVRAGMAAYRDGRLTIRHNLHLAIGLLAAVGARGRGRLEVRCVRIAAGRLSSLQAGAGEPVVMLHGLGATKAFFLPTIAALAPMYRVVALDLPGFGDAEKPLRAAYDPPFFAPPALFHCHQSTTVRLKVLGARAAGP
jgi:hypothetical protein